MIADSTSHTIYHQIMRHCRNGRKMLVRLIDPDKYDPTSLCDGFDFYFVGGSTAQQSATVVDDIHRLTSTPAILFPGDIRQYTPKADALLFLTLLNSLDPHFLILPHLQIATEVAQSGIEVIPLGYILLDGGKQSAVQRVTQCNALPQTDLPTILRYATTAVLLGKQMIYLEAGSGATQPIRQDVISTVAQHIHVPLIVGGGICTISQMTNAFEAGADIVVVGNHFENFPDEIEQFIANVPTNTSNVLTNLSNVLTNISH